MSVALTAVVARARGLPLADLIRILSAQSFKFAPKFLKYCFFLLFLFQFRSWPLAWHFFVWRPVFKLRGHYRLTRLLYTFSSAKVRQQKMDEWIESLSHVGVNPFDLLVDFKTWAGPDDCDYNLHLSNSSYPKRLDATRMKLGLQLCPTLFRVGGWMGLGATHFTFLREIPMFSKYEMRTSVMSWDNKWMYIVTRFVTKRKKGGKHSSAKLPSNARAIDTAPSASVHTANGLTTGSSTPLAAPMSAQAAAAQLLERPEPDGALINCLAVSEVVCKVGRITVPPALVLAIDGFCRGPAATSAAATAPYSHANPPPHWAHVQRLIGSGAGLDDKRGLRALRDFMAAGWREVPEGERWWEDAMAGEVEERRVRGLGCMQAVRNGMEEARTIL
ncbi:uncharacterized protein BXZ73DRAFT_86752 [Epithele typhae]|uniref:uncharacterized protein n=1 Tax=Epithele typhae TaxID=378194 RepID=UPI002007E19D|nr:uncharacterized protein BXZ73DRAFT_86752 [Epithele typhae]KAH9945225.1 hypothetical protein BXZ73DRAFT_86752 [Epithele typhae]